MLIQAIQDNLGRWWNDFSQPATIGEYNGQMVWERHWSKHYIQVFDKDGNLIGNWVYEFDFGEYPWLFEGDYNLEFKPALDYQKYRLSWISRLRSLKLSTEARQTAQILGKEGDDTIYGIASFTVQD